MTEIPDLPEPPADLSAAQYESVRDFILSNVNQAFDPLKELSDTFRHDLTALAFNDVSRLDHLERVIREAMRKANYDAGDVRGFKLTVFKAAAKQLKERLREISSNRAKLSAHNARIIAGSRSDSELADVEAKTKDEHEQAMMLSKSKWLRSFATLQSHRKGRIWHDDFYQDFITDWDGSLADTVITPRPVDDAFLLRAHTFLHRVDVSLSDTSRANNEAAVFALGYEDRRNDPQDWLKGLVWDKQPRLESWLAKVYGVPQNAYHAAVGRCWFVSMVARIMWPGCKVDTMPVLYGPQGNAKSTSLEIIGGKWYATINTSADKQDFVLALAGLVVAEIAELDAFFNKKVDVTRIKTLLSTREDKIRPPYGRTHKLYKRTVVMVGTTNETHWHRDETGGRRFWPIDVRGQIDLAWLEANVDQLWAEARVRYEGREKWWDVPEQEHAEMIAEHYSDDPQKDRLDNYLQREGIHMGKEFSKVEPIAGDPQAHDEEHHWGTLVTTSRILTQCLQIPPERQDRNASLRVARIMKQLGWEQMAIRTKNAGVMKAWVKKRSDYAKLMPAAQKMLDLRDKSEG